MTLEKFINMPHYSDSNIGDIQLRMKRMETRIAKYTGRGFTITRNETQYKKQGIKLVNWILKRDSWYADGYYDYENSCYGEYNFEEYEKPKTNETMIYEKKWQKHKKKQAKRDKYVV